MHIICEKNIITNAISIVSKAVQNKSAMNINECILLDAKDSVIKLIANDGNLGIETSIEGKVIEAGTIALDAKMFGDIIRKLPDLDIDIKNDEDLITTIKCGKSKFSIIGRDGDEFTRLPIINSENNIIMSQYSLKELIRQTAFSTSENDINKIMGGILFDISGDNLKVASLDGHRISLRRIKLKESYEDNKIIIPVKALNELSKIMPGSTDDNIEIHYNKNQILFLFDNTKMVSSLMEGEYFDVDRMILSDYESKVVINKKSLYECIDRTTLLVKENDKKPIILTFHDNNLKIKINSTLGSMDEDLEVVQDGKDIMIGFNPKFILDALKVIDDEEVSLYMMNSKAPAVIKDESASYIYLLLPINFTTVN